MRKMHINRYTYRYNNLDGYMSDVNRHNEPLVIEEAREVGKYWSMKRVVIDLIGGLLLAVLCYLAAIVFLSL